MSRWLAFLLIALAAWSSAPASVEAAANQCIRIHRQGNIETLVNVCNSCRVAMLTRARPGNSVPVSRKFNVRAKSTFPVPFRGPGRSRIKADMPCPGDKGAQRDLLQERAKPAAKDACVKMEQSEQLGVILVNTCGLCRAVAIERYTGKSSRVRDYMLLAGQSSKAIPSRGYAQVALLGDIECPDSVN